MREKNWAAKWIEYNPQPYNPNIRAEIMDGAPIFYTKFKIDRKPLKAHIDICGLGFYVLNINGKRVGDELSPAFSVYDKTVYYNTYSISQYLVEGENSIDVTLGNGWFLEFKKNPWEFEHASWRARHQLICEIFADDLLVLKTDSSWLCGKSKTVFNSLRYGETYDSTAELNDHINASIAHGPGGIIKPQQIDPVRVIEELKPVRIIGKNNSVYDFGVNISGNVEIVVSGKRGSKVSIQYCERIDENGNPDCKDIMHDLKLDRFQKDEYILSGVGEEHWHSCFGYNGFRYAKVSGNANIISVTARNLHTDLKTAGGFQIDSAFLSSVQSAVIRSTLTNFHHIPTDCPQREKNGWTGDAHLSCEQTLFNFEMYNAYIKYLDDIVDCQRANGAIPCIAPTSVWGYNWGTGNAWDAAIFEIPWQIYLFYADESVLRRYYPAMEKYFNFMLTMEDDGIWKNGLGDWCAPEQSKTVSPYAVLTAYAYRISKLFAKICAVLSRNDEQNYAETVAQKIKNTFLQIFDNKECDSQALLSMQLYFGLTNNVSDILERLIKQIEKDEFHITTGIFGTKYMFNVLTDYGRCDIAYKILCVEDYPGYKYMLNNSSGTFCENWSTQSASLNHHMYSSIGEWFFKGIAGIKLDETQPGFKRIFIRPYVPDDCKRFKVWHSTPFGKLSVEYNDSEFTIYVPNGCEGIFEFNGIKSLVREFSIIKVS